jgi:molybdopterin molybdotransferase
MILTPFDKTIENLIASMDDVLRMSENVFLTDTIDRVLSEDIVAKENSPEYVTSAMDGYALRYEDQKLGVLRLSDRLPAGTFKEDVKVLSGTCIKTFTGSLMSEGSDTLVPIENVVVDGDEVKIIKPVPKGFAVRPIAESYSEGEVLIEKGTKIGFAQIAVMAELGIVQVPVFMKPRVGVIATGSEILELGEPKINPAQIRSSNHVTLESILKQSGAEVTRVGIVQDNKELIKTKIVDALTCSDIVITTGGVSVGDYDFVKDVIKGMNPEYIIDRACIKPGRHIKVVKIGAKYIVALPGFPYSAAVLCFLYVNPLVRAMQGMSPQTHYIEAIIKEDYKKRSPYTEFTACNLSIEHGKFYVDLEGKKTGSSAIMTNMLGNSALLRIELETELIKKGELVRVLPMSNIL